jgi:DNA ligase-1
MTELVIDDDTHATVTLMSQLGIAQSHITPQIVNMNPIPNTNQGSTETVQKYTLPVVTNLDNIATYGMHEIPHNPDTPATYDLRSQQVVVTRMWRYVPIFKNNANGKPMIWQIGFDGNTNELIFVHGQVDGKLQTDRSKVELNQHSKSIYDQAVQEATQRYNLHYRNKGYRPEGSLPPEMKEAALANEWKPDKTKLEYPVYTQPKLDGMRVLARGAIGYALNGEPVETNIYRSRGQTQYPRYAPHFDPELNPLRQYLPPGEYDGEGMMVQTETLIEDDGSIREIVEHDFQHTMSVMKTEKTEHPDLKKVTHHIFDYNLYDGTPFEQRYNILVNGYNRYITNGGSSKRIAIVPCQIANSQQEVLQQHKQYVEQGYEGIIIRKIGMTADGSPPSAKRLTEAMYRSGKSSNLLKYKFNMDEEGVVIGVEDCKGREEGAAKFIVQDPRGLQFRLRMKGTVESRQAWLQNPQSVIGALVTYRFQEYTNDGLPRFPRGISIRYDHR